MGDVLLSSVATHNFRFSTKGLTKEIFYSEKVETYGIKNRLTEGKVIFVPYRQIDDFIIQIKKK